MIPDDENLDYKPFPPLGGTGDVLSQEALGAPPPPVEEPKAEDPEPAPVRMPEPAPAKFDKHALTPGFWIDDPERSRSATSPPASPGVFSFSAISKSWPKATRSAWAGR
jgi:hypothetical protein